MFMNDDLDLLIGHQQVLSIVKVSTYLPRARLDYIKNGDFLEEKDLKTQLTDAIVDDAEDQKDILVLEEEVEKYNDKTFLCTDKVMLKLSLKEAKIR